MNDLRMAISECGMKNRANALQPTYDQPSLIPKIRIRKSEIDSLTNDIFLDLY
ncbi:hypothetical protein JW960_16300 [candidate division KSB1 bacterium]|nr:hypothetical protein [candidate division KSB1 bacterium]